MLTISTQLTMFMLIGLYYCRTIYHRVLDTRVHTFNLVDKANPMLRIECTRLLLTPSEVSMPHRHVPSLHLASSKQGSPCQHMQTISLVTRSLGASLRANVKCLITLMDWHHCVNVDSIQHTHDSESRDERAKI